MKQSDIEYLEDIQIDSEAERMSNGAVVACDCIACLNGDFDDCENGWS